MKYPNAEKLLLKLIDIPSVSGAEFEIAEFLANYLETQGFIVETLPVEGNRFNVYARLGQPKVILQAHMDVVPPYIPAKEDENFVYGRGACDTKGSIASMIIAAQKAKNNGLTNFGLLFTVDEEVGFAGAKQAQALVNDLGAFLIVGEPSQLQPVSAHFGMLVLTVVCTGQTAHSSQPDLGVNAIDTLVQLLNGPVKKLSVSKNTLMSLVKINGGVAENVIPDRATAVFSFRLAPKDETDYVLELQKLIGDFGTVEQAQYLPPVFSNIPAALSFLGKGQQVKYCTELNFFKKGIVFGPGDIANAHTPEEKVRKVDLQKASDLYLKIISKF